MIEIGSNLSWILFVLIVAVAFVVNSYINRNRPPQP